MTGFKESFFTKAKRVGTKLLILIIISTIVLWLLKALLSGIALIGVAILIGFVGYWMLSFLSPKRWSKS